MRYLYLLIFLSCLSCDNERVLELPELEHAEITDVLDVSPAYIFYDDTQPDSTLLNRKNLIITTNWLVNVDKRLTLKQALKHIKFLQNKKRNAEMHKNEDAKNYFTCNDTAIKNLGFIDFTDVHYLEKGSRESKDISDGVMPKNNISVSFYSLNNVVISGMSKDAEPVSTNLSNVVTQIDAMFFQYPMVLTCNFKSSLSFQDYISIKSKLLTLQNENIVVNKNEFIF